MNTSEISQETTSQNLTMDAANAYILEHVPSCELLVSSPLLRGELSRLT